MKILRPKATAAKCGVVPITVHRWANDPKYAHMKFPKPMSMGENSVGFIEAEIDAWLEARAAERDCPAPGEGVDEREAAKACAAEQEDAEARAAESKPSEIRAAEREVA